MFQSYTCEQLAAETYRIGSRVRELGVNVDKQATQDKWAMGVGLVLFWPALFMVDGNDGAQSEYARLKGEYEAIQQAATLKGCIAGQTDNLVSGEPAPQQVPAATQAPQPGPAAQPQQPANESTSGQNQTDWRKWGQKNP